jgi:hydrogenase maturation protein HypF
MIATGTRAPLSSSAGRLFDAVAALAGLRQVASYEGQAAMELEWAIDEQGALPDYSIDLPPSEEEPLILDWAPMLRAILRDLDAGVSRGKVAAAFHRALAAAIAAVAASIGVRRVALSGGCFQNRHLLEWSVERLRAGGLEPFWHRLAPTNDGGISLGQAAWAAAMRAQG